MKTDSQGVSWLVVLLVLLPVKVEAAAARGHCSRDQKTPKITINNLGLYQDIPFGKEIIVHCSDEKTASLGLILNGEVLHADVTNTTTIQLHIHKLNLGTYKYSCVNSETGCEDSIHLEVRPAMAVNPSGVQRKKDKVSPQKYFVPVDQFYEVFCSGDDYTTLSIEDDNDLQLKADVVNSTTLRYKKLADRVEVQSYWCWFITNEDVQSEHITIVVDYPPTSEHFQCVIHDWKILECTWQYPSDKFRFALFYTIHEFDYDKSEIKICDNMDSDVLRVKNNSCTWDEELNNQRSFFMNQTLSFKLETCNSMYCNYETFNTNTNSLIKHGAVLGFNIIEANSHEAFLNWWSPRVRLQSADSNLETYCTSCVYRVEFRLAKYRDDWRQANTSLVRCGEYETCKFVLALPYPDMEYEVRVYSRHEDATDDKVWSDLASRHVRTQPRAACTCTAEHTPSEPAVSKTWCEACTLTEDSINENLNLKNKIESILKEKRAKVILELQKKSEKFISRSKYLLLRSKQIDDVIKTIG